MRKRRTGYHWAGDCLSCWYPGATSSCLDILGVRRGCDWGRENRTSGAELLAAASLVLLGMFQRGMSWQRWPQNSRASWCSVNWRGCFPLQPSQEVGLFPLLCHFKLDLEIGARFLCASSPRCFQVILLPSSLKLVPCCRRPEADGSTPVFLSFSVLLKNNWHLSVRKFKTYSLVVWFTSIVKWWSQ